MRNVGSSTWHIMSTQRALALKSITHFSSICNVPGVTQGTKQKDPVFCCVFFVTSRSLQDHSSPNKHQVLTTGQTANSRRGPILKKECINKNQHAYYTNAKAVQKMNLETCLETDSFLQEESFGSRLLKGQWKFVLKKISFDTFYSTLSFAHRGFWIT